MSIALFVIGFLLAVFSHPAVMRFVMNRLGNEGIVTPKKLKPEKVEFIRYAGANLSLFGIAVILMLLAVIIRKP